MNKLQNALKRLTQEGPRKFCARLLLTVVVWLLRVKRAIRWSLLRSRLPRGEELIVRSVHGSNMYLNVHDSGLSKDLLLDGTREPFVTELVKKEIHPGMIIADIGANIGYYALLESRLTGPTGRVIGVEPVTENIELLRKNIALNKYTNIETFHGAMGASDKQATIYVAARRNSSSMIHHVERDIAIVKEEPVTEYTFNSFFATRPRPDFVRMDVEGYERNIIKGMSAIIKDGKPLKILMEFHSPFLGADGVDEIIDTLTSARFSIQAITIERSKLVMNGEGVLVKIFNWCNRSIGVGEMSSFTGSDQEKRNLLHTPNFFQVLFVRT